MKDKKLLFDRSCHVLYSKPCKKEMRAKIALHYPDVERETVWEKVQRQYAVFLSDWRTDLGCFVFVERKIPVFGFFHYRFATADGAFRVDKICRENVQP